MKKKIISNCLEVVMDTCDRDLRVMNHNLDFLGVVHPGSFTDMFLLEREQIVLYDSLVKLGIINNNPDLETDALYEMLPMKYSAFEQNIKSVLAKIADNRAALEQAIMDESMGGNVSSGVCVNGKIDSEGKIIGWLSPGTNSDEIVSGISEISLIFKVDLLGVAPSALDKISLEEDVLDAQSLLRLIEQYKRFC
jgi:hypothetical protein